MSAVVCLVPTAHATLPGRNGRIAYAIQSCEAGCDYTLYTATARGTDVREVDLMVSPAFSPNGRTLAASGPGTIYLMPLGRGRTITVRRPRASEDCSAAWSPSGSELVIDRSLRDSALASLVVVGRDGRGAQRIGGDGVGNSCELSPDWSSTNRIAYVAADGGIRSMRRDNLRPRTVTTGPDTEPNWSPDGRKIAFRRATGSTDDCGSIFTVRADGTDLRRITRGACFNDHDPAWSPDGRSMLFTRDSDLMLMSARGTRVRRLKRGSDFGMYVTPAWQPLPR